MHGAEVCARGVTRTPCLTGIASLWLGPQEGLAQTRLFRRRFEAAAGERATIALYADTTYRLWCNGEHISRGPAYHHPHRRPIETYDLSPHLRDGDNVVAVLVYACGRHTDHNVHAGTPGLIARLRVGDRIIDTDVAWRVTDQTGWSSDVPRRTDSIGHTELFDATVAPFGWTAPDFDDRHWPAAQTHPPFAPGTPGTDGMYQHTGLPRMRHAFVAAQPISLRAAAGHAVPLHGQMSCGEFGDALDGETWTPTANIRLDGMTLCGFDGREAAVWVLDLGAEYTGSITFDFDSDSGGVIDVGWSSVVENGRPRVSRKGCSYADRYIARPGRNHWLGHSYSGGRYIVLILRGFTGAVRFERVGMLASEPDLPWGGAFECDDEQLNAVWRLCQRTLRVGVQGEGLIDCPTREQAPYIGDANLVASWIGRTTGDYAHWRYFIRETFASQGREGLVKVIVFSGISHVLLDYELLAITGARDYLRATGDRDTIDEIMSGMRLLLGWFDKHIAADGLLDFAWESRSLAADYTNDIDAATWNLFIDHCGMGWHNRGEPGLDRRGRNAAFHALLAMTWDAMAEMTGEPQWTRRADDMRRRIRERFWDDQRQLFADGELGGKRLEQFSQPTNTWCVMAGCVDDETARAIMRRILDPDDQKMARSGPYFWHYMLEVMARLGMHAVALEHMRRLWSNMIDRGATTTFETFSGDELDSLCHPWSTTPIDFLPRHVVGIGTPTNGTVDLHPRTDLLRSAQATVVSLSGSITLGWDEQSLHVLLPDRLVGRLHLPGRSVVKITGAYTDTNHRAAVKEEIR
jgi:hypothetical protein